MTPQQVELTLSSSESSRFTGLLQEGVVLPAATGCSLWSFLVDQLGIAPEYVRERISTIFLDGDVVDAPERAIVRDRSVLALSAAMPGLAGATLRRGGFYSAMRSAITHRADAAEGGAPAAGTVRVKLFNLLIPELGPALLDRGVLLEPGQAAQLLSPARVAAAVEGGGPVLFRVRFAPTSP